MYAAELGVVLLLDVGETREQRVVRHLGLFKPLHTFLYYGRAVREHEHVRADVHASAAAADHDQHCSGGERITFSEAI